MGEPAIQLNEMEATTADRIKYVVNGETRWYTIEELKEHIAAMYRSVGENLRDDTLDNILNITIKKLEQYNGDPYGHIKHRNLELYEFAHQLDAVEQMLIIR